MTNFLDTVQSTIAKHRMLSPGDRVLVGVSGGPDSMACLLALVALRDKFRLTLRAVTVDHGLRPSQTRQEAALVKRACRVLGVGSSRIQRKVRRAGGESLEEACRKIRYDALIRAAQGRGFRTIALGHTQDDQAETVLMWILRGTGTDGLAGIPPVRKAGGIRVVRPLLDCSRKEVEDFLKAHQIRPSRDPMNDSVRFLRSRIRKELLPLLSRRYNPQIRKHLAQLADFSRAQRSFLEAQARQALKASCRLTRRQLFLDLRRLKRLPETLRRGVLQLAVQRILQARDGFAAQHWLTLERMVTQQVPSAAHLPAGLRAELADEHWLVFSGKLK